MMFGRKARRHRAEADRTDRRSRYGPVTPPDAGRRQPGPTTGVDPQADPRTVDLRVLLLTSGDDEPSTQAWSEQLDGEGVPFDQLVAGVDPLTTATLERGPRHGRYQAVILATDSLVRLRDGVYESSLDAQEWATLRDYLRDYGVRQISAYSTPGPTIGLKQSTWAGDLGDVEARLTDAGRAVFTDLAGDVPLSTGTYGFQTEVLDAANFTTLVSGRQDSPVVGVFAHPDGREELVVTVASGPFSRHMHLLGHGMLAWVTRGRHLGHHGYFLSMQVDDVLLGRQVPIGADPIRMNPDDVLATARWSQQSQVRLDFAFNGWGAVTATMDGGKRPADRVPGRGSRRVQLDQPHLRSPRSGSLAGCRDFRRNHPQPGLGRRARYRRTGRHPCHRRTFRTEQSRAGHGRRQLRHPLDRLRRIAGSQGATAGRGVPGSPASGEHPAGRLHRGCAAAPAQQRVRGRPGWSIPSNGSTCWPWKPP